MSLSSLLLVGGGGFLGAIARYALASLVGGRFGTRWPWATLVVNLTGCLAIGLFFALEEERALHGHWRHLIAIGFIGAYTTFSTYEYETLRLAEEGAYWPALAYLVASTVLGLVAVGIGIWVGRRVG